MADPAKTPVPKSAPATGARMASKWSLPRLPLLVSVIGLGAVVTTGTLFKRRADARLDAGIVAVRTEMGARRAELDQYDGRFKNLRWNAEKIRQAVESATPESHKAWARERAR